MEQDKSHQTQKTNDQVIREAEELIDKFSELRSQCSLDVEKLKLMAGNDTVSPDLIKIIENLEKDQLNSEIEEQFVASNEESVEPIKKEKLFRSARSRWRI